MKVDPETRRSMRIVLPASAVMHEKSTFEPSGTAAVGRVSRMTRRTSASPTMLGWSLQWYS